MSCRAGLTFLLFFCPHVFFMSFPNKVTEEGKCATSHACAPQTAASRSHPWCLSMSVVSPCGMLFTQGLRIPAAALHRLRQHRLHHAQPVVFLLWPGLALPRRLPRELVARGREQPRRLALSRGCRRKRAQQSAPPPASTSPQL